MYLSIRPICIAACLIAGLSTSSPARDCRPAPPPARSLELGFRKTIIDSCPSLKDLSLTGVGDAPFFSGQGWDNSVPAPEHYNDDADGVLDIKMGGAISTLTQRMEPGRMPLLPGGKGFYVEFTTSISDNDPDHFPALWMMPIEHNRKRDDSYDADHPLFERWQEIDVDEGGFTRGFMGTAISWSGVHPKYERMRSSPRWHVPMLDRTVPNRFAASFDPAEKKVKWFLNDGFMYEASGSSVSDVASKQNYYLIVTANHHGKKVPYTLKVFRVRAFTSE